MKYRLKIAALLATATTTRKQLEKIHGCLNYVAGVEPFGRPFLASLTSEFSGVKEGEAIKLSPVTRMGLEIWEQILKSNKGISMDFILNRLPSASSAIYVDASSS